MRPLGPSWPPKFPPHRRWEHVPVHAIQAMFRHVFVRWGLPDRVRVDNGYPWGSSRDLPPELALWLIGLGVEPIWNPPAQPTRNPKVERSNGLTQQWGELRNLHRLQTGGSGVELGRPHLTRRVPCDPGADPLGGVPATPHAAAWVSAGPREGDVGSLPSGRLLGPGMLEAACRSQWNDLDLRALPSGRSGVGSTGIGGAVRCVITVLVGLQSRRGNGQAVAGEGTNPGADHCPRGQPPPVKNDRCHGPSFPAHRTVQTL